MTRSCSVARVSPSLRSMSPTRSSRSLSSGGGAMGPVNFLNIRFASSRASLSCGARMAASDASPASTPAVTAAPMKTPTLTAVP